MKDLKNKIVLITGSTGGLGSEMARQFRDEGSRLILSDLKEADVERQKKELGNCVIGSIALDLSGRAGCEKLFNYVKDNNFTVDILVNNAGIAAAGKFEDVPDDLWEKVIELDLVVPMRLTKLFLEQMLARGEGHLVQISSVAGLMPAHGLTSYSAAKFGLRGFGETLAGEVVARGVDVSIVYPFFTRTAILDSPQFGLSRSLRVPEFMVEDPKDVIREMIAGIRRGDLHIYPGMVSKAIRFSRRVVPDWLHRINSRILKMLMD